MPVEEHEINALIDHLAPGRGGRGYADAEETEAGFEHHGERDGQDETDDDRADRIGNEVAADDVPRRCAKRLSGAHEFLFAEGFYLRTDKETDLHPTEK